MNSELSQVASGGTKRRLLALAVVIGAGAMGFVWIQYLSDSQWRERCARLSRTHNWIELRKQALEWHEAEPDDGEALLFLAQAYDRLGQYEKAANALELVPPEADEFERSRLALVDLCFGPLKEPLRGAEACEMVLESIPESRVARQRLIFFLAMTRQRKRMIEQIYSAMKLGTETKETYIYLFFADAPPLTNAPEVNARWSTGSPDSQLFEVGRAIYTAEILDAGVSFDNREAALSAEQDVRKKREIMDSLLEKYPHNIELLAYHLDRARAAGEIDRVISLLSQAPVESETDNRFWRMKGWIHFQRKEYEEAEFAYRRAIELHYLDLGSRALLAELYQQLQRFDEVAQLRDMVEKANELRREIQTAPRADQVPRTVLVELAEYAAECGDKLFADSLRARLGNE